MRKMKKAWKAITSLLLAVCMIITMLPETAVMAAETGNIIPSISGITGYDCYGQEPYMTLVDDGTDSAMPTTVNVILNDGTTTDIPVSWEKSGDVMNVILSGDYPLSDNLASDISNGIARLPWIQISTVQPQTIEAESETEVEAQTAVSIETEEKPETTEAPEESVTESESEAESVPESETEESTGATESPEDSEGAYTVSVESNISGVQLSIDGAASIQADPGETVYITADGTLAGNMYFSGVYAVGDDERPIDVIYDDQTGFYVMEMPDCNVVLRPAFGWLSVMAAGDSIGTTHTVTNYGEQFNQGLLRVGYFEIDGGTLAWCTQHSLTPPLVGATLTTAEIWDDDSTWLSTMMRRIAYYGYSGPGAETTKSALGLTDADLWRYTSLAFSYAFGADDNYYGYGKRMVDWLSSQGNAPAGYTVYRLASGSAYVQDLVYWTYEKVDQPLSLKKVSEIPSMTDGNDCYSLEGAEYGVYSDPSCTQLIDTLITDDSGNTQSISVEPGNYYIKELKASKGYGLSPEVISVTVDDQPVVVTAEEPPLNDPLGITLSKIDAESGESVTQGAASLEGAQFTINYYDGYYTKDNLPDTPTRTWVLETKETTLSSGKIIYRCNLAEDFKVSGSDFYYTEGNPNPVLPLGTLTVEETKAPTGYTLDEAYLQAITGGEKVYGKYVAQIKEYEATARLEGGNEFTVADYPGRGGISIQKVDADTGKNTPQGNATIEGAVYAIINENDAAVIVNGHSYAKGEEVLRLTTDADGRAQTSADALPYGNYSIIEVDASTGYLINSTKQPFTVNQDEKIVPLEDHLTEQIIRGGVKIQKRDQQSGDAVPEGGATLEGAVFEITNMGKNPVVVDGKTYANGDVVVTLTTNAQGIAQTAADALPYGQYQITEVTAPKGYLGEGIIERTFNITENGVIVDMTGEDQAIHNQVIRGDFELTKIDAEHQNAMAGIPFKITSNTTGESHTFTTDANGFYSSASSWNPHSQNTNGGGAEDGLWFGLDADGNTVPVDDSMGALPFDTYTIEELRCDANADKVLYKGTLTISRDGYTVDMGNIENETVGVPEISTSARNEETGSAYGSAKPGMVIIDTVTYTGLTPKEEYTIKGTLMNAATQEPVTDADGEPVTAEKTFTPARESGTVDVEFVFDASGLDGADVVVFEKLYRDGELEGSHEDINDEGQTIHFPGIGTTAKDAATGTHTSAAKESVTIIDTVAYHNLQPGRSYTMSGVLMDKATQKALVIDGREVTASTTFIPDEPDGTIDVVFVFDASDLGGKDVVVFETLYRGTLVYASHEDIEDDGQTIHFPRIGTTATDGDTGDHIGNAGAETVTIIDTVQYTNLIPGNEYTVTGTLMDKATGKALEYDGQTFTATQTFTAQKPDGSVEMTFKVPGAALIGKAVVAFETITYDGVEVAVHADIHDDDQTVYYPDVETTAKDKSSGTHQGYESRTVTIIDTVQYTNLMPGKEYTIKGVLMDKATGEPYLADGKAVTSERTFTPEKASGTVELEFTFSGAGLTGHTVVVFETVYYNGIEVAAHADIEDDGQTVDYPDIYIGTTATDALTGTHDGYAREDMKCYNKVVTEVANKI